MKIKCGCKINLYLRITGKREDGYHNLDTIFLPLDVPYDILKIKTASDKKHKQNFKSKKNTNKKGAIKKGKHSNQNIASTQPLHQKDYLQNIEIKCNTKGIDTKSNTLTKAYALYSEATGFSPKLCIELKKGIPHGAGLGGGSSNAAHLLQYLQEKNKKPLPQNKLLEIASKVGADVPFFLFNTPCHALGIGEILTPISLKFSKKQDKSLYLVLVSPYQHVSTKEAFENLDTSLFNRKKIDTPHFAKKEISKISHKKIEKKSEHFEKFNIQKKSLTKKDILDSYQISCFLKNLPFINDFEKGIFAQYPFIGKIKEALLQEGAFMALMSGTGSSIYGIFEKKEIAKKAVKKVEKLFNDKAEFCKKQKTQKNAESLEKKVKNTQIRVYPPLKIL